jgi:CheY-like chemotaxis protein
MLARRLKRLGYEVVTAHNGRTALEQIRRADFDLVLLDILMPEMNGYEVLATLKSDPKLAALPVIVISASDRTENVAACIGMGAEDHLSKPFDPVILQARISASL